MKGKREPDELLISYLLEELNEEDKARVEEYINFDEKNRQYFEELKKSWKLSSITHDLEKINIEQEWRIFEQSIEKDNQKLSIVKRLKEEEEIKEVPEYNLRRSLATLAVAASIFMFVVTALRYSQSRQREEFGETASNVNAKTPTPKAVYKQDVNSSGKAKTILLKDGSQVILSDKSEISYYEPFISGKREIILKGKAEFNVAKDKTKPFTVHSSSLATTAIGTRFTITDFENTENIIIRLHEGKVLVRTTNKTDAKETTEYYLVAGQELIASRKTSIAKIVNFAGKRSLRKDENYYSKDQPVFPDSGSGSWYMFNNQSLDQVLYQLELLYGVEINYKKKDIQNRYFIGKYDKKDSLNLILKQIASLNNFKLIQKDNKFFLIKKKK